MISVKQTVLWETIGCSISTHSDAGATRTRYWLSGGGGIRRQSRTAAIGSTRVFYFMFPAHVITRGKRRICCYLCAVHPCRYSEVRGSVCYVCARNTQKWTPKGGIHKAQSCLRKVLLVWRKEKSYYFSGLLNVDLFKAVFLSVVSQNFCILIHVLEKKKKIKLIVQYFLLRKCKRTLSDAKRFFIW
jgi:hypothetical protein